MLAPMPESFGVGQCAILAVLTVVIEAVLGWLVIVIESLPDVILSRFGRLDLY